MVSDLSSSNCTLRVVDLQENYCTTRMHSNRMHTARLLTVSRSIQRGSGSSPGGCLPLVSRVCLPLVSRGCLRLIPGGVSASALGGLPLVRGGVCHIPIGRHPRTDKCMLGYTHPPVDRQTSVKTLPSQTTFLGGNYG